MKMDGQSDVTRLVADFRAYFTEASKRCVKFKQLKLRRKASLMALHFPIYVACRMLYWVSEMNFNSETCLAAGEQIIK